MVNGFYIVSVGIQNKGGVVAGMVCALSRGAIVLATVAQRGVVERIHRSAVLRLECQVVAPGQDPLRSLAPGS